MKKSLKQLEAENDREYRLKELNKVVPGWVAEYRFHPKRKWMYDFANPLYKIACEVEGGVFVQGRHSRGVGMIKDMEKYNTGTVMGWQILRFTPDQKELMIDTVREALLQGCQEVF